MAPDKEVLYAEYPLIPRELIDAAPSQYQQDLWVLNKELTTSPHESSFFYLEIGCGHGILLNNTYLLERCGWKGISVDPFPMDWSARTNPLVKAAIWDREATTKFVCGAYLGGIEERLGKWRNDLQHAPVVEVQTVPIKDFLIKYNVPPLIHYLSLDTEGSEYDILAAFPFDEYTIKYITVEHNHEEPKRTQIRTLLEAHGYVLEKTIDVEDFYVKTT